MKPIASRLRLVCHKSAVTATIALLLLWVGNTAFAGAAIQRAFSDPPSIRADGRSNSLIIVQLQDASGAPAPDGIIVNFSTSLGSITPTVETRGGIARARLTSGSSAGTAIVGVMAEGSRYEVEVEFTSEGGETQGAAAVIEIKGKGITFSQYSGVALLNEEAELKYGALVIKAAAMQFRMSGAFLAAQGDVVISNGEKSIQADALALYVRQGRGSIFKYEADSPIVYDLLCPSLTLKEKEDGDLSAFRPLHEESGRTEIIAKQILILPDGQVIFDDASILLDSVELFSFPHYATSLGGGEQDFLERTVCFAPDGGLTADFPYHYAANANRIGSLRLMHNLSPEGGQMQDGWGLNLQEQYFIGDKMRGSFNIDNFVDDSRVFRWNHSQELSDTLQASSRLRYSDSMGSGGRLWEASSTLSKSLKRYSLDLSLNGSSYAQSDRYSTTLSARMHSKPIGNSGFAYSTSMGITYREVSSPEGTYLSDTGVIEENYSSQRKSLSQTISMQLHCPQIKVSDQTTIDYGLSVSNTWNEGDARQMLSGRAGLRRPIGKGGSLSLDYSARMINGSNRDMSWMQSLSSNFNAGNPGKWLLRGFASYDIEMDSLFSNGSLCYYLPFDRKEGGVSKWKLALSTVVHNWQDNKVIDNKISLSRAVGNWGVSLNYAPNGSSFDSGLITGSSGILGSRGFGFTQDLGRTLWIEISPGDYF